MGITFIRIHSKITINNNLLIVKCYSKLIKSYLCADSLIHLKIVGLLNKKLKELLLS